MTLAAGAASKPAPGTRVWHVSEVHRPAKWDSDWFSSDDIPLMLRGNRKTFRVQIAMSIDTDGVPIDCWIVESSGDFELDGATCKAALAHGHFRPAVGDDGKPKVSEWTMPVVWRTH